MIPITIHVFRPQQLWHIFISTADGCSVLDPSQREAACKDGETPVCNSELKAYFWRLKRICVDMTASCGIAITNQESCAAQDSGRGEKKWKRAPAVCAG